MSSPFSGIYLSACISGNHRNDEENSADLLKLIHEHITNPKELENEKWVKQSEPKTIEESQLEEPDGKITEQKNQDQSERIMGKICSLLDARLKKSQVSNDLPKPVSDGLYADKAFPLDVALDGEADRSEILWKRPGVNSCLSL